ncbi:MAG: riboflavin biosynthesis protein RibF [Planctomycetota bacterium]
MKLFEGLDGLRQATLRDPVATVGFFDGVHRGHRQLLYELRVWALAVKGESCVITFRSHPLAELKGIDVPAILSVGNRLEEFERHGIDAAVLLDFTDIQGLDAASFLRDVVREGLGCSRLLLGFDSHIGKGRQGTPQTLPALGAEAGVEVRIASPVLDKRGKKIGSRFIRDAISRGELEAAANALGRPYSLRGSVQPGSGRGRSLGAATANVDTANQVLPPDGVYLARVFRRSETAPAIVNVGVRPTFGEGRRAVEVHVPGWSGDLYGEVLEVRLVQFVRPERRFANAEELAAQIALDLEQLSQAVDQGRI